MGEWTDKEKKKKTHTQKVKNQNDNKTSRAWIKKKKQNTLDASPIVFTKSLPLILFKFYKTF